MKIYLHDNVRATLLLDPAKNTYTTLEIVKGCFLDVIEFVNLPKHIQSQLGEGRTQDIVKHKIFIVYLKRNYWVIDAYYVDKTAY